jgi:hypothetical protein
MVASPTEAVALKIVERYSHPGRTAYLYLFQLKPGVDFASLIPEASGVIAAWIDEGANLVATPVDTALAHCKTTQEIAPNRDVPQKLTSHQRRQMMARAILFSVNQLDADEVEVHLVSRALIFSPKGDREVNEKWLRSGDSWYSAYQPDEHLF